jgi:hypothetical protein
VATGSLLAPKDFEAVWASYEVVDESSAAGLLDHVHDAASVVIIADPIDEDQADALRQIIAIIDSQGHAAPPMFLVPHTVAPKVRRPEQILDQTKHGIVRNVLECGVDGVIAGEPEGFSLALAVRAKFHKSVSVSRSLNEMVNERREQAQYVELLSDCVNCIIWDYLRMRMAPSIPPVDYDLTPGEVTYINGYTFGAMLGKGMFGSVYQLTPDDGSDEQVVKVVPKSSIKELQDLKSLKRMIGIMQLLSGAEWSNENICQMYEVHHSPSHLFFRMEFGGPENLYRRLSHRQRPSDKCRPLSLEKATQLLDQAIRSVSHLHTGPRVCHRDIKPENFIVSETEAYLSLKLADFDLALVQESDTALCRTPCGTVPFTAPEVLVEGKYNGKAADIWSLGVVFIEILCGVKILERVLSLGAEDAKNQGTHPDANVVKRIRAAFEVPGSVGNLITTHCRKELQSLLDRMTPIISGMLTVDFSQRWTALDLLEARQMI